MGPRNLDRDRGRKLKRGQWGREDKGDTRHTVKGGAEGQGQGLPGRKPGTRGQGAA